MRAGLGEDSEVTASEAVLLRPEDPRSQDRGSSMEQQRKENENPDAGEQERPVGWMFRRPSAQDKDLMRQVHEGLIQCQ